MYILPASKLNNMRRHSPGHNIYNNVLWDEPFHLEYIGNVHMYLMSKIYIHVRNVYMYRYKNRSMQTWQRCMRFKYFHCRHDSLHRQAYHNGMDSLWHLELLEFKEIFILLFHAWLKTGKERRYYWQLPL